MPPLARLRHPLIQAFDDQFAGRDDGDLLRESISAVSDRQWLKQKFSSRWRGAAVLDVTKDGSETVWLGAAGYRREGSKDDFYAWFSAECADSSDVFMPAGEDRVLERVDKKISLLDAWKLQTHLAALALLAAAAESGSAGPLQVLKPDDTEVALLQLHIEIETIRVDTDTLTEATLVVTPAGWEHAQLVNVAIRTVLAAVEPRAEAWRAAPLQSSSTSYAAILTEESIAEARLVAETGDHGTRIPAGIRLGAHAHYARAERLAFATIEGEAVQAMCGYWFVPMHDHDGLDVCEQCTAARDRLSG